MSRERALAASIKVPQRRLRDPLRVHRFCRLLVVRPGTLFVLIWWGFFLGVVAGPNMLLNVLPKSSWFSEFSSWACWRDAMNSATGGKVPLPPGGWGAILNPFINLRSFCLFFLPPAPWTFNNMTCSYLHWYLYSKHIKEISCRS